jgi:hypothetical protein
MPVRLRILALQGVLTMDTFQLGSDKARSA